MEETSLTDTQNALNNIEKALSESLLERHTLFQLQCFILAKEPTIQGKLHQCLREIKARKRSIDSLQLEIEEQEDQLKLIDLDIEEVETSLLSQDRKILKKRSLDRKKKAINNNLTDLTKKHKDINEELMFFCRAFDQLHKVEKLKPWDDPEVQKQYWSEKLKIEVNTRLLLRQLPDLDLMKTILCLHDDAPVKRSTVDMLRKAAEAQNQQITAAKA